MEDFRSSNIARFLGSHSTSEIYLASYFNTIHAGMFQNLSRKPHSRTTIGCLWYVVYATNRFTRLIPFKLVGIASGINYLHGLHLLVIHGDIRAASTSFQYQTQTVTFAYAQANVLINELKQPVLADYCLSSIIGSSTFTSARSVGVHRWLAREHMREETKNPLPYSQASDMFSYAMTIIEVLSSCN